MSKLEISSDVFGPDSTGRSRPAFDYLVEFIDLAPQVNSYTFHHYSLSGYSSKRSDYLRNESFALFENEVKSWSKLGNLPLILGETAVSFGHGSSLNSFITNFYLATKLKFCNFDSVIN